MKYWNEYLLVLGNARSRLRSIVVLTLLSAFSDVVGLGLVAPIVAALVGRESGGKALFGVSLGLFAGGSWTAWRFLALLGGIVIAFSAKGITAYWMQRVIVSFSENHRRDLMVRLMRAYLSEPYEFHLRRNSASLVNTILEATSYYSQWTLTASLRLLADGVMLLAILSLLIATDFTGVLLLTGLCGLLFLVYDRLVKQRLQRVGEEVEQSTSGIINAVNQGIGSFRESKVLGVEESFLQVVHAQGGRLASATAEYGALQILPRYLIDVALTVFLALFCLIVIVARGGMPQDYLPALAVFAAAGLRLVPAVNGIFAGVQSLRFSSASLHAIASDLKGLPTVLLESEDSRGIARQSGEFQILELQNVTYTYPGGRQPAVRSVSLTLVAGEAIGLVGRSGAGKSTLADILLGLLKPQRGCVVVDGLDLWEERSRWFQLVAYVPQTIFLLDDTLRRNIALGVPDSEIEESKVAAAIEAASLTEVIAELPLGLDTVVGERGARLSGGQKQRVALARALYHDRSLIVMDEATTALDPATEQEVVAAIKRLKGRKTLVIIAHRSSTLEGCDKIYRIESGSLDSEGVPSLRGRGVHSAAAISHEIQTTKM